MYTCIQCTVRNNIAQRLEKEKKNLWPSADFVYYGSNERRIQFGQHPKLLQVSEIANGCFRSWQNKHAIKHLFAVKPNYVENFPAAHLCDKKKQKLSDCNQEFQTKFFKLIYWRKEPHKSFSHL